MTRSGADLALLLLAGFRTLADRASAELADRGYEDVRPAHDFALRAILAGADSASDLGRATSVTKQAAAKTIAVLEERGYVVREPDKGDRRRMRVHVTARGLGMLREGERIFDRLRQDWERQVGTATLDSVAESLRALVGDGAWRIDAASWDVRDLDA